MNYTLSIILSFFFTGGCQTTVDFEHESIMQFLNDEKICVNSYHDGKECLKLKGKKIFVVPYLDTLHSELYLRTNQKEFVALANNYEALNQIDSLSGQKLNPKFFDGLRLELTDDVYKAEIKLSLTSFFTVNEFSYCVIQISEGKYKQWIIKLKEKEGKIIASEVTQVLD